MSSSVDTGDQEATAMYGKASGIYGQVMAGIAFYNPELIAIGKEKLDQWLAAEPRLKILEQYIDYLFRRQQHVRSSEVEQIIGLTADPFNSARNTYDTMNDADMKFPDATGTDGKTYTVAQGTFDTLMDNPDRDARRTAWEG
jgi:oligoendopeptidase F